MTYPNSLKAISIVIIMPTTGVANILIIIKQDTSINPANKAVIKFPIVMSPLSWLGDKES